jgi:hypothetical protein
MIMVIIIIILIIIQFYINLRADLLVQWLITEHAQIKTHTHKHLHPQTNKQRKLNQLG